MTRAHRSAVAREAPRVLPRLFTLREFVRLASSEAEAGWCEGGGPVTRLKSLVPAARDQRGMAFASEADDDVPDPYGGPEAGYASAFALIDPAVTELARLLASGDGDSPRRSPRATTVGALAARRGDHHRRRRRLSRRDGIESATAAPGGPGRRVGI